MGYHNPCYITPWSEMTEEERDECETAAAVSPDDGMTQADWDARFAAMKAEADLAEERDLALTRAHVERVNVLAEEHGLVSRSTLADALHEAVGATYKRNQCDTVLRRLETAQDVRYRPDLVSGLGLCRRELEWSYDSKPYGETFIDAIWNVLRERCPVIHEDDGEVYLSPPYLVELNEARCEVEAIDDLWLCMLDFNEEWAEVDPVEKAG